MTLISKQLPALFSKTASFCNSLEKMAEAFEAVTNIEKTMNRYVKPCDYMEVSLGADQLDTYLSAPEVVLVQFVYMKNQYQEVVNNREFGRVWLAATLCHIVLFEPHHCSGI